MQSYIITTDTGKEIYAFIQKRKLKEGKWRYEILTSLDQATRKYYEDTADPQYKNRDVLKNYLIASNAITVDEKMNLRKIELPTKSWIDLHENKSI